MKPEKEIETLVKDLSRRADDEAHDRILGHLIETLRQHKRRQPAAAQSDTGRTLMNNPIAKLAVAAVIIAAVVLGLFEFLSSDNKSGVIWAEVAERVQASGGMTSRLWNSQIQPGLDKPVEFDAKIYISPQHGYRMESFHGDQPGITAITNNTERKMVMLTHLSKEYFVVDLPEEVLAEVAQAQAGAMNPKSIVAQLLSADYTKLGRETIDGVEAEGVEIKNPPGGKANFQVDSRTAQLWVSVETGYPVKMVNEVVGNNGSLEITQITDQFEWNVELDPELFELNIPEDYTETEPPPLW